MLCSYNNQGENASGTGVRGLSDDLWVAEHPLRVAGVEFGRRMTVVRLDDGNLWLHSVARLTPDLQAWLGDLGPVRFIVAPNQFHTRYLETYRSTFPEAEMVAAPGLVARREDLAFMGPLGDAPHPGWAGEIDQFAFAGTKGFTEIVFFHPGSRTLVLTDLCFNFPADAPWRTRLAARFLGVHDRLATSRTIRLATRDRDAARASRDRMLAWDFDRVIVGHGDIVETGGREAVERAFAWLD